MAPVRNRNLEAHAASWDFVAKYNWGLTLLIPGVNHKRPFRLIKARSYLRPMNIKEAYEAREALAPKGRVQGLNPIPIL